MRCWPEPWIHIERALLAYSENPMSTAFFPTFRRTARLWARSTLVVAAMAGTLAASPAVARAPLSGLSAIATASPQEIMKRLRRGHGQVDALLLARAKQAEKVSALRRDRDAAANRVDGMKQRAERGAALEKSLRAALVLDENFTYAQSQLVALDGEIAREGAQLLRLYDAILNEKHKEARKYGVKDARRAKVQQAYRALVQRRDGVRQALLPVMGESSSSAPSTGVELVARPDDDIESLMDKADLARDLETRFLRRAQAVRKRIKQLEAERTLARDVIGIASTDSLFDESDHRVLISRGGVRAGVGVATPFGNGGGNRALLAAAENAPNAPVQAEVDADDFLAGEPGGQDVGAPAPPSEGETADPTIDITNGFENADNDGVTDGNRNDAPVPNLIAPALPAGVTERAFAGETSDQNLAALMASDTLTLPQLRALERKLEREAARLRGQSKKLRKEVSARARSRR